MLSASVSSVLTIILFLLPRYAHQVEDQQMKKQNRTVSSGYLLSENIVHAQLMEMAHSPFTNGPKFITEKAISELCTLMTSDAEYERQHNRKDTIKVWLTETMERPQYYRHGCIQWTNKVCEGYPNLPFDAQCTFWYPVIDIGTCIRVQDEEEGGANAYVPYYQTPIAQDMVSVDGHEALQLCTTISQAASPSPFALQYVVLRTNQATDLRCNIWQYITTGKRGVWKKTALEDLKCKLKNALRPVIHESYNTAQAEQGAFDDILKCTSIGLNVDCKFIY